MVKPWAWLRLLMKNMKLEEEKESRIKPLGFSAPGIDRDRQRKESPWRKLEIQIRSNEWEQTRLILKTRRGRHKAKKLSNYISKQTLQGEKANSNVCPGEGGNLTTAATKGNSKWENGSRVMGYISRCFLVKMKAINPSIPSPASPVSQKLNFSFRKTSLVSGFQPWLLFRITSREFKKNDTCASFSKILSKGFWIDMTLILF